MLCTLPHFAINRQSGLRPYSFSEAAPKRIVDFACHIKSPAVDANSESMLTYAAVVFTTSGFSVFVLGIILVPETFVVRIFVPASRAAYGKCKVVEPVLISRILTVFTTSSKAKNSTYMIEHTIYTADPHIVTCIYKTAKIIVRSKTRLIWK